MRALLLLVALIAAPGCAQDAPEAAAQPAASPEASGEDPYAGVYANESSTPRLFLIRDGRYVQFLREWDDRHSAYEYAYELEDAYDYTIEDGAFTYQYTDTTFDREGDRVTGLTYRGADSPRISTLRELIAINEWDVGGMMAFLTEEHGMSEAEATARLDDAEHFALAVHDADELTFADLVLSR